MTGQSADGERELVRFKTEVNLSEFAAAHGYALDRNKSCRSSVVMVHSDGDKIVIARALDGHWVYFSVRDDGDRGTILDFVQRREGVSLGHARRVLRPWLGGEAISRVARSSSPLPDSFASDLKPVARDISAARARFEAMLPIDPDNAYLTVERCIPPSVLAHPRFHGVIRLDGFGNVVFPHVDGDGGVCGYEIRSSSFTGFAAGGAKALWRSDEDSPDDGWLVLTESSIDALSYAALLGATRSRFASIAGRLNAHQPVLIRAAIESLPSGGCVVLAYDNDDAGDALTHQAARIIASTERTDLRFTDDRPEQRGSDWNDVLRRAFPSTGPHSTITLGPR